ncbi:MAG: DNA topoisomerase, partial [Cetobacterium sp.]|nr:DNA topoisomerase [Cetobacterium sp.]
MKKVIIAEKPSLGATVARAIGGNFEKKDGYFENENYIVTFGFGHLYELYSMDDYFNREKTRWNTEQLPFVPLEFKFKVIEDSGVKKQVNNIKKLVNRKDVDTIINCGDADREGQVIGHLIISNTLENNKSIKRLWLPDQTDETIRLGLNNLKDDSEYRNLLDEGLVRTYVDWLYGINLTQLVSCKKGTLLPVGRVIIPIVEVIEKRDRQIENFVPTTYYQAELTIVKDDTSIKLTIDEKFENESDCKVLVEKLKGKRIVVKDIEKKDVIKQPKKLFSLDKLQNKLSKDFKLSASESLKIIQGLYEKGYVTYPRTNTEYLAEEEKEKIKKIIDAFNKDNI